MLMQNLNRIKTDPIGPNTYKGMARMLKNHPYPLKPIEESNYQFLFNPHTSRHNGSIDQITATESHINQ